MTNPWDEPDGEPTSTTTDPTTPFKEADEQVVQVNAETITKIAAAHNFTSISANILRDYQKLGLIDDVMGKTEIENGMMLVTQSALTDIVSKLHALTTDPGLTPKERKAILLKVPQPMGYLANALAKLKQANRPKEQPAPAAKPEQKKLRVLRTDIVELGVAKLPD